MILLCCLLTLVLGWWSKARCLTDGGWTDHEQYLEWCYSDIYALYFAERLHEGAVPYVDHPVEYPVLTGAQMQVAALLARVAPEAERAEVFFHVSAVIGGLAAVGVLLLLAAAGLPRRRLLWWALSPSLAIHAFINWDPLPVLLLTAAIVLHLRGRDVAAGVSAALGTAAKLIPGVVVPLVALARWRQGRPLAARRHVAAFAGTWLAVNLPVALFARDGWLEFFRLNRERGADWDTLWFLAERVTGASLPVGAVNLWSLVLLVAGGAVILRVGTRRRDPSQWWSLALPLLVWFLLTNKVYSPQYSLWLVPLMALTMRDLAPYAAFVVADSLAFVLRFPFLAGAAGLITNVPSYEQYGVVILVRAAVLVWILVASTLHHDPDLVDPPARADTAVPAGQAQPVPDQAPA